jgi:predicted esterase
VPCVSVIASPAVRKLTLLLPAALALFRFGPARAEPLGNSLRQYPTQPAWCAPEVEALTEDVCHVDGGDKDGRRSLVIFLHGAIAERTTWQWTQERALLRQAKQSRFEAIFPRAPLTKGGFVWPGSVDAQKAVEGDLVTGWTAARRALEARNGRPFDDVFVMGFSSGAYFVSSLATRGKLDVDGFAVFAGAGSVRHPEGASDKHSPIYVGVCGEDAHTSPDSRAFGQALGAIGWPHRVDEQKVGHMFSDIHVAHAVSYLRAAAKGS